MFWLVVGYLFLFIFRPYEFWPILGYFHIERMYMIFLLAALLLWPQKRYIEHPINRVLILFFLVSSDSSPSTQSKVIEIRNKTKRTHQKTNK